MLAKISIEILELEQNNYHLLVPSVFENGEEGKWVIDTGASKSVFDQNLEGYYQTLDGLPDELHSAGFHDEPITSSSAVLKTFSLGKFRIEGMKVALIDLSHINSLYSKSTRIKICGLLGSDFLLEYKAEIDYRGKRLVLRK